MAALQTVQRIGPVLDLFTVGPPEVGVSEVSAAMGVPRWSATRCCTSLVDIRFSAMHSDGRYRIGWRIVKLDETLQVPSM